jgi:hypothetical protein
MEALEYGMPYNTLLTEDEEVRHDRDEPHPEV